MERIWNGDTVDGDEMSETLSGWIQIIIYLSCYSNNVRMVKWNFISSIFSISAADQSNLEANIGLTRVYLKPKWIITLKKVIKILCHMGIFKRENHLKLTHIKLTDVLFNLDTTLD